MKRMEAIVRSERMLTTKEKLRQMGIRAIAISAIDPAVNIATLGKDEKVLV